MVCDLHRKIFLRTVDIYGLVPCVLPGLDDFPWCDYAFHDYSDMIFHIQDIDHQSLSDMMHLWYVWSNSISEISMLRVYSYEFTFLLRKTFFHTEDICLMDDLFSCGLWELFCWCMILHIQNIDHSGMICVWCVLSDLTSEMGLVHCLHQTT